MVQDRRPSCSSWAESAWSSFGRTIVGKAIWENPIAARLGKGFQLGMPVRTPSKRAIHICVCGWHKIGWKETKHLSDVAITQQRNNIFLWSCILGMHSKTMWNKQRYCGQLQSHVWIENFSGGEQKSFHTLRIFVSLHGLVIWRVMQRNVWRRHWELANKTTQQLYKVSTPCIFDHHFKEEEMKSVGEMVTSMLSNCSKMLKLGTNWKSWYSMVSD